VADSGRYTFRNLELWKAAQQFAVDVSRLADGLPGKRSADISAQQLIRAATSIPANIAEGHGRYTLGAYRNHLSIAKGSASECEAWLDLLAQLGHIPVDTAGTLEQRCVRLIAALARRITALETQERERRIREDASPYDTSEDSVAGFEGSSVLGLEAEEDE
jgi:four helix bundle protein